jgi:hypothetical protein
MSQTAALFSVVYAAALTQMIKSIHSTPTWVPVKIPLQLSFLLILSVSPSALLTEINNLKLQHQISEKVEVPIVIGLNFFTDIEVENHCSTDALNGLMDERKM